MSELAYRGEPESYRTIGCRTVMGTDWSVENVVRRTGARCWTVLFGFCNGVPSYSLDYRTRKSALEAAGIQD